MRPSISGLVMTTSPRRWPSAHPTPYPTNGGIETIGRTRPIASPMVSTRERYVNVSGPIALMTTLSRLEPCATATECRNPVALKRTQYVL